MSRPEYKSKFDITIKNKGDGVLELCCFIDGNMLSPSEVVCLPGETVVFSRKLESDVPVMFDNTVINLDPSGNEKSAVKMSYKTRFN
jgi:hypothetical protein